MKLSIVDMWRGVAVNADGIITPNVRDLLDALIERIPGNAVSPSVQFECDNEFFNAIRLRVNDLADTGERVSYRDIPFVVA